MKEKRLSKSRPAKSSANHIYSIISISMILFLVGFLIVSAWFTRDQITRLKEDIEFEIELDADVSEGEKVEIRKLLSDKAYVRTFEYISKDEAVEWHQNAIGQDYVEQLGFNPLYDAFVMKLNSEYVHPDSVKNIQTELMLLSAIKNVSYQQAAVEFVSSNLRNAAIILGMICIIFFVVAITLIDSTIRLSMYSQRFLIRSMQLIGATRFFILRPFLGKSVRNGIISAVVASAFIIAIILYVKKRYAFDIVAEELLIFAGPVLLAALVAVGVMLSVVSTWISVRKYLRVKLDELY
jgi:cell division transport system permease protein